MTRRYWAKALVIVAAWTLAGLFLTTQTWVAFSYGGRAITWEQALRLSLADAWIWAVLTVPILWIAARIRFRRTGRLRVIVIHSALSIFVAIFQMQVWTRAAPPVASTGERPLRSIDLARAVTSFKPHMSVLIYWAIVGLSHGLYYYHESRERALRASQLEARLAQAQLEALRMQLHPHFLFNTLHSIATLMHRDVEAADLMVARLSDLLRLTLDSSGVQEVPLQRELDFLEPYLAIERVRFPDRLRVDTQVDPDVLDARVPNLFLQPLVENAIRYAVAPRASGGEVLLRACKENGRVRIDIADDGPGLRAGWKEGVGLSNTRTRLQQLYGTDQLLRVDARPAGGVLVRVEIPFRT